MFSKKAAKDRDTGCVSINLEIANRKDVWWKRVNLKKDNNKKSWNEGVPQAVANTALKIMGNSQTEGSNGEKKRRQLDDSVQLLQWK